jgi:hypothetical protein
MKSHRRYLVRGQEMYFYYEVGDTKVFYYYVDKEVLYFMDANIKKCDLIEIKGALTA